MIKKLKLRSNQKFYKKNIEKNLLREKTNSKIKRVLVLIDETHREKIDLYALAKNLNTNKVNVKILLYRKFEKQQEFLSNFFTEKDFGFGGSLKSNNLKDFVKNSSDLLISYAIEPNLYLNMVTLFGSKIKNWFWSNR